MKLATGATAAKGVAIQALKTNTGNIAVGGANVVAAAGASQIGPVLEGGESISVPCDDLSDIYIDSTVSGEGVTYLAVVA